MNALNRLLTAASVLESTGEVQGGNLGALLVELAASIRGDVAELTRGEVAAPGEVAGGGRAN